MRVKERPPFVARIWYLGPVQQSVQPVVALDLVLAAEILARALGVAPALVEVLSLAVVQSPVAVLGPVEVLSLVLVAEILDQALVAAPALVEARS